MTGLEFVLTLAPILLAPGTSTLLVSAEALRGAGSIAQVIAGDLSANAGQILVVGGLLATLGEIGSPAFFGALKWIGVIYLVGLAATRLVGRRAAVPRVPPGLAFLRGFLVSASNPKALVFLFGLFPAFLEPARPLVPQLALLGGLYLALDGLCLAGYALASRRLATASVRMPARRIDRLAGGMLLLAGVLLAAK